MQKNRQLNSEWLTTKQVAGLLGYSAEYVGRICLTWAKFGVKTYYPSKRKILFKTEEINRWIESTAIN